MNDRLLTQTSFRKFWKQGAKTGLVAMFLGLVLLIWQSEAGAQSQLSTALGTPSTAISSANATAGSLPGNKTVVAAAAGISPEAAAANPYGLSALWFQGDWVARGCLLLLVLMSSASWYVLVAKMLELRQLRRQTREALGVFADARNFSARIAKLGADNPLRFVAMAGTAAVQNYPAVKARVDYDTWLVRAIEQALSALQNRAQNGMAVLATIGSTAPFVGLFGTVWAIYSALVRIGASGQASIDRVAGPVGEALIMTAIGLAVAVPAVFGYNWLLRQNKLALEAVRNFGARVHVMLLGIGDVAEPAKPVAPSVPPVPSAPVAVEPDNKP